MRVIRTFVAVLIAQNLKKNISGVQEQIKKLAPDVKWVDPENFHVTLKFLGDVSEDAISDICAAVKNAVRDFTAFDLSMSGLGAFPSNERARVVWVGIEDGRDELAGLARAIDDELARLGYEREDRPFRAHLTIGRAKDRIPGTFAQGIKDVNAEDLGTQRVGSVVVMRSDLRREGPIYSPLCEVELAQGA